MSKFDWIAANRWQIDTACQSITNIVLEEVLETRAGNCLERGGEAFQRLYETYGVTGVITAISATATTVHELLDASNDSGTVAMPIDVEDFETVSALFEIVFGCDDPAGIPFFDAVTDLWIEDFVGVITGWHMLVHIAADIDAPRSAWARLIAGASSQN